MAINVSNIVTALQQKQNLVTSADDILEISKLLKAINTTNEELVSIVDITYVDGLEDALDLKANQSTTYTKTEVDSAISAATPTFDTILSKPTTIAGYGISDAYTKTEVNSNISSAINGLIDSAPTALDTLNELSAALGDDENFASTVTTSLSNKVDKTTTVNGHALSGNVTVTASDVGLSNVDNTSDTNKPVSTATQTALDLKAPLASPTFTGTVSGITKTMVGLGNVLNTDTTTTANISDSTNKRFITDAQRTVLTNTSGTNTGDQTITLTGDITGSGTGSFSTLLANSGVTAGTYGSSTSAPVITVDAKGRVTSASSTTVSGVVPAAATSSTLGGIKVSLSGTTLTITTT